MLDGIAGYFSRSPGVIVPGAEFREPAEEHRIMTFRRPAFSLIELLVVIAIIALLVSILLPTIQKARVEAWKVVSMSNLHSICQANFAYQHDYKNYMSVLPPKAANGVTPSLLGSFSGQKCTWSGWGKNCEKNWSTRNYAYDVPAAYRPLNPYLCSDPIEGPKPGQSTMSASVRKSFELLVCKDPSQRDVGYQQQWGASGTIRDQYIANDNPSISCYDDVGTSYQWQFWWLAYLQRSTQMTEEKAFRWGMDRFTGRAGLLPTSFMIWCSDEWTNLYMRPTLLDNTEHHENARPIRNGYGDTNKGVVGYLDGHVRYVPIYSVLRFNKYESQLNDPNLQPRLWSDDYTPVFLDKAPKK